MALTPVIASARPAEPGKGMTRARDRRAIAASAAAIGDPNAGKLAKTPRRQPWQEEAWGYRDQIGEFWHAQDFVGNCFSRITLRPGYIGDDDKVRPVMTDDDPAIVAAAELAALLIRQLRAPTGGQPALLKSMGQNISVAGEFYLLGTDTLDEAGQVLDRTFEALSIDEIRVQQGDDGSATSFYRMRGPGYQPEPLPSNTYPLRIWNPHPRYSAMADSSARPLLEILEEIVLLTRTVRSSSVSRLVQAGVYWIPSEIDYPKDDVDIDEEEDPWTRDFLETAAAAISDKASAAAAVPLVARAPGDDIAKIRHDTFAQPDDALSVTKRTEAIHRLAQGIDLPVETTLGSQQTTFSNGEIIDESTFKVYLEPKITVTLDGVTVGYLHPSMLAAMRQQADTGLIPDVIRRMVVWYDATELVLPPDRSKDAIEAYDRYELSGDALIRELGFADGDKPDPEEIAERVRRQQMLNVKETVRADETGTGGVSLADPNLLVPSVQPGAPSERPQIVGGGMLTAGSDGPNLVTERLRAQVATAVNLYGARALERAGARLRSKANGDKALAERMRSVPLTDVPAMLGPDGVVGLGLTADGLLAGEFAAVAPLVAGWAADADRADAAQLGAKASALCERLARSRMTDAGAQVDWATIEKLIP